MTYRIFFLLVVSSSISFGQIPIQFEPFGLQAKTINDLRIEGPWLFAAADSDGVYVRDITSPDSTWSAIGLAGKKVNAVYPHFVGPVGPPLVITVGVTPKVDMGDTTRLYCSSDSGQTWGPSDSGISIASLEEVTAVDGFPSPFICGETFIRGSGKVYRKGLVGGWEKVFEGGGGVVRVGPSHTVWAAGVSVAPTPYVARSTDAGDTWDISVPSAGGDNEVYSLIETESGIVYIGLRDFVLRSDDSAKTWFNPMLCELLLPPARWLALEADYSLEGHVLVGGALNEGDSFVMLETMSGGTCWSVFADDSLAGISSIVKDPFEENIFYVGTLGSGVFRFAGTVTSVDGGEPIPREFHLSQNYPNPFNPSTTIRYELPSRSHVVLKIFNLLGQEVATLADEEKAAGRYEVRWDASRFSSGMYLYRLQASGSTEVKMMLLIR